MANFVAVWSGEYPNLCAGEWTICRNGVDVSNLIPDLLRHAPMGTRNEYPRWYFEEEEIWDEDGSEVVYGLMERWAFYWDGLSVKKWIRKNRFWIDNICRNMEERYQLYHAINAADWRHSSCGGCI